MTTGNNDELVGTINGLLPASTLSLLNSETRSIYTSIIIILKIYPVLVLVFGSFGNLLSFCVLIRANMRRYSTFCYLACLALVDLGVIITFSVNFISLYHFNYDIQDEPFPCKLFAFSIYFLPQYSSWILVAVSIDRVISAKYLRLAKQWSKPRHSVLVTFLLGLFLAVLNSHFFIYENNSVKQRNQQPTTTQNAQPRILPNDTAIERFLSSDTFAEQHGHFSLINTFSGSVNGNGETGGSDSSLSYEPFTTPPVQSVSRETTLSDQFDNSITIKQKSVPSFDINIIHCSLENSEALGYLYPYWAWIDLAMNVFIPFTGKIKQRIKNKYFILFFKAMIACTIIIILTLIRSSSRAGSTSARRSRRRRNISVMLVTVNLVFISLTAPIVIFLSLAEYVKDEKISYRQTIIVLIKSFCIILMNLNHSVNIVIYSVTAKEFRSEMVNFLHSVLYCIIGKPINQAGRDSINDDGTFLSRLRRLRQNLFKCCRMKVRKNSTNTTDSSGLQHTTALAEINHSRSSNSNKINKRKRLERNGNRKHSHARNSEISINRNSHRLTVQLQADPTSSICEREDISFHGLSISTED